MKQFRITPHTADTRLFVEAHTDKELFSAALEGMNSIINKNSCAKSNHPVVHTISLKAQNKTALLIDFLSEVLSYSHTDKAVFCRTDFNKITDSALEATIYGSAVGSFDEDVKAATYHETNIVRNKKGNFETMIVFDI